MSTRTVIECDLCGAQSRAHEPSTRIYVIEHPPHMQELSPTTGGYPEVKHRVVDLCAECVRAPLSNVLATVVERIRAARPAEASTPP